MQNIRPIQAVPHIFPNAERNPNGYDCEDHRNTTTAIQNILKEPTINTVRHGQALEQSAKIFDNATENLETQLHHKAQTSSMATTRDNIRATPRVHARVTRNNTPGIIPTTIINTEGGKEFPPPISDSEGGKKRERKINSKNERKKRQENREPAKKINDERKADSRCR